MGGIFIHHLHPLAVAVSGSCLLLEGTTLTHGAFPTAPSARFQSPLQCARGSSAVKPQGPLLSSVVSLNPDHDFISRPFITLSSNCSFQVNPD